MINFKLTSEEACLLQGHPNSGAYVLTYQNEKLVAGQWCASSDEIPDISGWLAETYPETNWLAYAYFNGQWFDLIWVSPTDSVSWRDD